MNEEQFTEDERKAAWSLLYEVFGELPIPNVQGWKIGAMYNRLHQLLRRAVTELAYIQEAPTKELCQTSEGREIIAEAEKLLERIP